MSRAGRTPRSSSIRTRGGQREARYLIIDWGGALGRWGSVVNRGRWDCARVCRADAAVRPGRRRRLRALGLHGPAHRRHRRGHPRERRASGCCGYLGRLQRRADRRGGPRERRHRRGGDLLYARAARSASCAGCATSSEPPHNRLQPFPQLLTSGATFTQLRTSVKLTLVRSRWPETPGFRDSAGPLRRAAPRLEPRPRRPGAAGRRAAAARQFLSHAAPHAGRRADRREPPRQGRVRRRRAPPLFPSHGHAANACCATKPDGSKRSVADARTQRLLRARVRH